MRWNGERPARFAADRFTRGTSQAPDGHKVIIDHFTIINEVEAELEGDLINGPS